MQINIANNTPVYSGEKNMEENKQENWEKEFDEISERQIFLLEGKKGTLKNTIVYESLKSFISSLILQERTQERLRAFSIIHEIYIQNRDTKILDILATVQQKIVGLSTTNKE